MLYIYEFCYCATLECVSYNYISEIWPTHLRSYGSALSGFMLFVMQVIFSVPSATAFANISWRFFLVFIALTAFNTVVAYFKFPETRGLPLEEIGKHFGDVVEVEFNQIRLNNLAELNTKGPTAAVTSQPKIV